MLTKTNGGPAFPRPAVLFNGGSGGGGGVREFDEQEGMSLRDYFAARAPVEPQSWFVPVMDRQQQTVPTFRGLHGDKYATEFSNTVDNRFFDVYGPDRHREMAERIAGAAWCPANAADDVMAFALARYTAMEFRQNWDAEYERERFVQWPYAWADAMLAKGGTR